MIPLLLLGFVVGNTWARSTAWRNVSNRVTLTSLALILIRGCLNVDDDDDFDACCCCCKTSSTCSVLLPGEAHMSKTRKQLLLLLVLLLLLLSAFLVLVVAVGETRNHPPCCNPKTGNMLPTSCRAKVPSTECFWRNSLSNGDTCERLDLDNVTTVLLLLLLQLLLGGTLDDDAVVDAGVVANNGLAA
jgi:hypothetical protein